MNFNAILLDHLGRELEKAKQAIWQTGYNDYPSFNLAYQYDDSYHDGYLAAYKDNCDALEEKWLDEQRYPRSAEIDRRNGF